MIGLFQRRICTRKAYARTVRLLGAVSIVSLASCASANPNSFEPLAANAQAKTQTKQLANQVQADPTYDIQIFEPSPQSAPQVITSPPAHSPAAPVSQPRTIYHSSSPQAVLQPATPQPVVASPAPATSPQQVAITSQPSTSSAPAYTTSSTPSYTAPAPAKSAYPIDISDQVTEVIAGVPIIQDPKRCGQGDLEIRVNLENVRYDKGTIVADLHDDVKENFLVWDKVVLRVRATPTKGETSFCMPLTKPGDYAIAIYHDKNGNKEFDKNFLGIPKEHFGMSQNPKFGLSSPKFEETVFSVGENGADIRIKLFKASDIL